jgi:hypothetical protein
MGTLLGRNPAPEQSGLLNYTFGATPVKSNRTLLSRPLNNLVHCRAVYTMLTGTNHLTQYERILGLPSTAKLPDQPEFLYQVQRASLRHQR